MIGIKTSVCRRPKAEPIRFASSRDSIATSVADRTAPVGSRRSLNSARLIAICISLIWNCANCKLDPVSKRCIDGLLELLEPTGITMPGLITRL